MFKNTSAPLGSPKKSTEITEMMTLALQETQKSMGIRWLTACKILAVSPGHEGSAR